MWELFHAKVLIEILSLASKQKRQQWRPMKHTILGECQARQSKEKFEDLSPMVGPEKNPKGK